MFDQERHSRSGSRGHEEREFGCGDERPAESGQRKPRPAAAPHQPQRGIKKPNGKSERKSIRRSLSGHQKDQGLSEKSGQHTQTFLEQPEKEKTRQGETAKAAIQGIPSREA